MTRFEVVSESGSVLATFSRRIYAERYIEDRRMQGKWTIRDLVNLDACKPC